MTRPTAKQSRALVVGYTRLNARRPTRCVGLDSRGTPPELYAALNEEFGFTLDPCPLDRSDTAGSSLWGKDGTQLSWVGHRVFCNPPYSDVTSFIRKAREADVAVFLLPAKSDLSWWHDYVMQADEVRFIRGRLRFEAMSGGAPFPSVIVVFNGSSGQTRWTTMERPPREVR